MSLCNYALYWGNHKFSNNLFNLQSFLASDLFLIWCIIDWRTPARGGRPLNYLRNFAPLKWAADYFPIQLRKTFDLPPDKNYIIGYHPHGILPLGAFFNFCKEATGFSEKFPGLKPKVYTKFAHDWCCFAHFSQNSIFVPKVYEKMRYVLIFDSVIWQVYIAWWTLTR